MPSPMIASDATIRIRLILCLIAALAFGGMCAVATYGYLDHHVHRAARAVRP